MKKLYMSMSAALAAFLLSACGQEGVGTQDDPYQGYMKTYKLPSGELVDCIELARALSCDWNRVRKGNTK